MEEIKSVESLAVEPKPSDQVEKEICVFDTNTTSYVDEDHFLAGHNPLRSNFNSSKETIIDELLKDPQSVNSLYNIINSAQNESLTTNVRLQELKSYIHFALTLGFVPIPLKDKAPVLSGWQKINKSTAISSINKGFAENNANNIGIICGKASGIVVVDIDTKNDGLNTWNYLISQHGDPYTFKVRTGSGGYHYYFRYDSKNEMLKSRSGAVSINGQKVGIDIKTNGGQVVFIASIHPDTKQKYEWVNNNSKSDDNNMPPISEMPYWLLYLLLETESSGNPPATQTAMKNKSQLIRLTGANLYSGGDQANGGKDDNPPPIVSEATLTELVNKLNVSRASNYDDWIKVVWGVKCVSQNYFHIARHFSQRTDKNNFDEKTLQKVWDDGKNHIGLGSLLYWLKWDVDDATYSDFLQRHNLERWEPIPCEYRGEGINSHKHKTTWHTLIKKYHRQCIQDIRVVVNDIMECIALVVGADENYFVKERYDKYGALLYNLAKSSKFEKTASKYYFMESNGKRLMTWTFKDIICTYLSKSPYNCIDFAPAGNEASTINTFTGLRAARIKYDVNDLDPILIHVREALCNDDTKCYEYFLNKLAYFLQNLGVKKLGVADMIISPQGIGKNIFYEHFGRYILGEQYWYITSDINKLTGRFNKNMMGKLLIIGDEAKGHGKTAELIKPLITQEVQWVEPKGFEQFKISDWAMYVFFANSARYFEVEDGDRRYFVLRGNEKYKGNKQYFDNFADKFQKFSDAFYSFLMDRDISSFNIQHIPCTPIKLMLQESAGSSCRVFIKTWDWIILKPDSTNLLQYCENGKIPVGEKIRLADLHSQYVIWCNCNGVTKVESKIQFAKDLADLLISDSDKMKWLIRVK